MCTKTGRSLWVQGKPSLQSGFQNSQGYTGKPRLKTNGQRKVTSDRKHLLITRNLWHFVVKKLTCNLYFHLFHLKPPNLESKIQVIWIKVSLTCFFSQWATLYLGKCLYVRSKCFESKVSILSKLKRTYFIEVCFEKVKFLVIIIYEWSW